MQDAEAKAILEAALLSSQQPMTVREMLPLLEGEGARERAVTALAVLQAEWAERGSLQLVDSATGWRFVTQPGVRAALQRLHPERPQRYSRAALETLAVIAYRQPVTRGDIEDIRGVVVSSQIIKQLEDRGWIDAIGHRDAPGRPQLYATTRQFLADLGLKSLAELPPLDETMGLTEPHQPSLLEAIEDAVGADLAAIDVSPAAATDPDSPPATV